MSNSAAYDRFLAGIIDDGIAAAVRDYGAGTEKALGSTDGFEACRGRAPDQLAALLGAAREETREAYQRDAKDYWFWRCRELEIEWVCNVVSAALRNAGFPVIVPPTARGVMKAVDLLGVAGQ